VYEKIDEHARIDLFDASCFATIRMLADEQRLKSAGAWFDNQ
jgi:phage terminase large subunit-like protein